MGRFDADLLAACLHVSVLCLFSITLDVATRLKYFKRSTSATRNPTIITVPDAQIWGTRFSWQNARPKNQRHANEERAIPFERNEVADP